MYKIAIENKDGEKYEFECDGTANLYAFTEELGIKEYPYSLKIGENRNGVKVRLKADNDFDESIAKILKENRNTLSDALIVSHALGEVRDEWMREEIERNAVNEQYETKADIYEDIRKMKIGFSVSNEDFYCPLHVRLHDTEGYDIDLVQEDIVRLEEEIREKLKAEQEETEMTGYVGEQANIEDKLVYAEWSVETRNGNLYGKISCYFRESLTDEETERLKRTITGQNSDGFGESFEQHPVRVDSDDIYVSFWDDKDYFLKTSSEMDEYLQQGDIKMGGI